MSVRPDRQRGWFIDFLFTHADGRKQRVRRRAQVQTKKGALAEERKLRQAMLDPPRRESPTLADFAARWLPTLTATLRPQSIRLRRYHVRVHLLPCLGGYRLDQLRGQVLERFFADLASTGLGPKSRSDVHGTLRRILRVAHEWGELSTVPTLPKVHVPEREWSFYGFEESERLLAAARDAEDRVRMLCAMHTGARLGEQLALRWDDVDLRAGRVSFRRSTSGPTKSGRSRHVPLTERLASALRAHRHLRGPLVFCREDGRPLLPEHMHATLDRACKRAGLPRHRWHDLRHTIASHCAMRGIPLQALQAWLGHATLRETMRYAHLAPSAGAGWIKALDGGSSGTPVAQSGGAIQKGQ